MKSPYENDLISILLYADTPLQNELLAQVQPSDFTEDCNVNLISILKEFKKTNPDKLTNGILLFDIIKEKSTKGNVERLYGSLHEFLTDHLIACTSTANAEYYIKDIKEHSQRRKLYSKLVDAKNNLMSPVFDLGEVIGDVESAIADVDSVDQTELVFEGDSYKSLRIAQIRDRIESPPPILTGFSTIDQHLSEGFEKGKITVIAGRAAMGKSTMKANLILNFLRAGHSVINFSPEQGGRSEMDRLDSMHTGVDNKSIKYLKFWEKNDPKWKALEESMNWFADKNYYLIDKPSLYYDQLWQIVRKINSTHEKQVDFLVIDLFKDLRDFISSKEERIVTEQLLLRMEQDCKKYNIHPIIVHQLNREAEGRPRSIPKLRDLKGAGVYEEKASNIFFIHREARVQFDEEIEDNEMKVIIAKQREGISPKIITMDFNGSTLTVSDKEVKEQGASIASEIGRELPEFDENGDW